MVECLPNEIIFSEILIRLSAKDLLRFNCVSKLWCKSISDPCFVNAHLTRQRTVPPGGIQLDVCNRHRIQVDACNLHWRRYYMNGNTLYYHGQEEPFNLNLEDIIKRKSFFELMASCDGLLVIKTIACLCRVPYNEDSKCEENYYLLNPTTKTCMLLPIPSYSFSNCRLLYDANSNTYIVVGWKFCRSFCVLSIGSYNTKPYWRILHTEPWWRILFLPKGEEASDGIITVNGQLLWLKRSSSDCVIRSLSVTNGEVETIMLPEYNIKWELRIIEIKGCLHLVNFPNKNRHCFIAWILEDWEKKTWTKKYQKYFWRNSKHECEESSCICLGSDFFKFDFVKDSYLIEVYDQIMQKYMHSSFCYFSSLVDLKQTRKKRKRKHK